MTFLSTPGNHGRGFMYETVIDIWKMKIGNKKSALQYD